VREAEMEHRFSAEQRLLCHLISWALTGNAGGKGNEAGEDEELFEKADMGLLIQIAKKHKVLPLLYDVLCSGEGSRGLSDSWKKQVEDISRRTVKQSYRLLFLTRRLVKEMEEAGLSVLVLKGCGAASLYPVPELRKSGDVDLLVRERELEQAAEILAKSGFYVGESQHANHHRVYCSPEGIDVELHTMLAEPFRDERLNRCMRELLPDFFERKVYTDCMGVELPVPMEQHQALQLLLHMLQHFLRSGFGLKLLCDWVVFWNREEARCLTADFLELTEKCHIRDFAETVTRVCMDYLGLDGNPEMGEGCSGELSADFLWDVFEAEEFGKADRDRMVIVENRSLGAYLKEFHYQMKMNHPRASKHVLLWPGLWVVTLAVFLNNNRKLNRGSAREIMRNAGRRSRLVQQMGLWVEKH